MLTLGLDIILNPNQRHQEMLAEAERLHLVQEALKTGEPKPRISSRILGYLGKKLVAIGTSLDERYSARPQAEIVMDQQTTLLINR